MEEAQIQEILKDRRILLSNGKVKPGKEEAYLRVQKLIRLYPNDTAWVKGVASTAFVPNTQHVSFMDVAQEKGLLDENYIPVDEEEYETIRDRWDDNEYESFSRKRVEAVFEEKGDGSEREQMKFFNDDSECW